MVVLCSSWPGSETDFPLLRWQISAIIWTDSKDREVYPGTETESLTPQVALFDIALRVIVVKGILRNAE